MDSTLVCSAYDLPVPKFTCLSTSTLTFDAKNSSADATDAFYDALFSDVDLDIEKATLRTTQSRPRYDADAKRRFNTVDC
jgi:hypothetical protein